MYSNYTILYHQAQNRNSKIAQKISPENMRMRVIPLCNKIALNNCNETVIPSDNCTKTEPNCTTKQKHYTPKITQP